MGPKWVQNVQKTGFRDYVPWVPTHEMQKKYPIFVFFYPFFEFQTLKRSFSEKTRKKMKKTRFLKIFEYFLKFIF